ncbi:MAG: hypothetical protein M3220_18485 [Chloroflexota bacterium]|nr:hypothetical protein [Chloroflexota bacterium]
MGTTHHADALRRGARVLLDKDGLAARFLAAARSVELEATCQPMQHLLRPMLEWHACAREAANALATGPSSWAARR